MPEVGLLVAILRENISLLTRENLEPEDRIERVRAGRWIAGNYGATGITSFAFIAELIGYDPDKLRRGILEFAKQNQGKALRGIFAHTD